MHFVRLGLVVAGVAAWLLWTGQPRVDASHHVVFINEVLAGANGDSRVQFVEIVQNAPGQHCWSPQVPFPATAGSDDNDDDCYAGGAAETRSRAMLVFFDAQDREIGRYKFPENPPGGQGARVLIGTVAFAALTGAPAPDFIMPAMMSPVNGKVCFKSNSENGAGGSIDVCVSYGAFAGVPGGEGTPAGALPTIGAQSLGRLAGTHDNLNSQFTLGAPTPTNNAGNTFMFPVLTQVAQGEKLFNLEAFGGNGRTCSTCHVASLSLGMNPANITTRFADVANSFDPLFVAETAATGFDFNLNTLVVSARPAHQTGTDFLNTSGGDLQGIITDASARRGKVLTRVNATTYRIYGGLSPALSGIVTDAFGNQATVVSVTAGDLSALEVPAQMRSERGLILENIDGFANPPLFRKAPHLLNLSRTAPFGFSADFPNLQAFTTQAVRQHFPRTLARSGDIASGANPDFRLPTAGELAAMEAFMLAQEFPAGSDPERFNVDQYVMSTFQQSGRDFFFVRTGCDVCHGGPVLATTTADILGKGVGVNAAFNTGTTNREISTASLFTAVRVGPPFFHNGRAQTLSDAVNFYDGATLDFPRSPAGRAVSMNFTFFGSPASATVQRIVSFLNALVAPPVPRIDALPPITIDVDDTSGPRPFTVGPFAATLSGVSSNPALIPNGNIVFGGTGLNRTVTVTPVANQAGSSTITVTATALGGTTSQSFTAVVTPINDAPTMTAIADVTVAEDVASAPIAFVVGDVDNPADSLTMSARTNHPALHSVTFGGVGANRTLTIVPSPNQFGRAQITVIVSDGRLEDRRDIVLTVTSVDDPPTITDIANRSVDEDTSTGAIPFTIADVDDPAAVFTLTASSSNPTLFPPASLVFGGSGGSRTFTATPAANQSGTATFTVVVEDKPGFTATDTFVVTVNPVNDPPAISFVPDQSVVDATAIGPLPVTVSDVELAAASISLSATSSNQSLIPNANILLAGGGASRAVTLGIVPNVSGTAVITLAANDGAVVTTRAFTVTVTATAPPAPPVPPESPQPPGPPGPPETPPPPAPPTVQPPGAPTALAATVRGGVIDLVWVAAPASDEPSATSSAADVPSLPAEAPLADAPLADPATGYRIEVGRAPGQSDGATFTTGVTTSFSVSGLLPGTYYLRVRAFNSAGDGPPSNEVVVTLGGAPPPPACAPGPPVLTGGASGTILTLAWTPSPTGGAPTNYLLQAGSAPGASNIATITFAAGITSASAPVPDGTYYLRVTASNACGPSLASNEVVVSIGAVPLPPTPTAAPGAPGSLTSQVVGSQVTLIWTPPVTGGAPTRYIIEVSDLAGNPIISVDTGNPATTFTHTGAPSGVYAVRVRAANAGGIGPPSAPVVVTIP